VADRLLVDADALARLLHAAADRPDPTLRAALVELVRSGTAPAPSPRPWLSLSEAAELLGVNERTVRREVERGRLDHRRIGRRLLIAAEAVGGPGRTRADTGPDSTTAAGHRDTSTDPEPRP
jgi:excisionase family DNA binding protein